MQFLPVQNHEDPKVRYQSHPTPIFLTMVEKNQQNDASEIIIIYFEVLIFELSMHSTIRVCIGGPQYIIHPTEILLRSPS